MGGVLKLLLALALLDKHTMAPLLSHLQGVATHSLRTSGVGCLGDLSFDDVLLHAGIYFFFVLTVIERGDGLA